MWADCSSHTEEEEEEEEEEDYDRPRWHYDLSNVMTLGILTRTNTEVIVEMKRQVWFLIPHTAVHVQRNVIRTWILLI